MIEKVTMWKDGIMLTADVKKSEVPDLIEYYRKIGWVCGRTDSYFFVESPEYTKEMQKIRERRNQK